MTMSVMFVAVLLTTTGFYVWFVLRVFRGLGFLGDGSHRAQGSVSIIVAARNEEDAIDACISSVLGQEYPAELLELIIVNDMSEDATAERVAHRQRQDPRVRLLSLAPKEGLMTGRKPEAIALGVANARGEYVITTDADCTHGPRWVSSMLSRFDDSTALVAGPVTLLETGTVFPAIERLDMLGLIVSAAGLIGAGRPIICSGANLSYRRSAFEQVRDNVQMSSNDDGTLMSRIVTRGIGTVGFALDPDAVVRTRGTGTPRAYFRQRMRWASVRSRFLDRSIYAELAALFLFFAALLAGTVAAIFVPPLRIPVLLAWVAKFIVDAAAFRRGLRALALPFSPLFFFAAQLFHPVGIVLSTLLSIAFSFTWKGRSFSR